MISLLQHQDAPPTSSSGAPSDIDTKIAIQSTSGQGKVDGTQTGPSVETRPIEEQLPLLPPLLADQCREEVTLLASLCPISVPEDYLADVFLNQSNKDLQTAANKILEQGPEVLQAEIISWEAASTNQGAIAAANTTTTSGRGRTMTGDSPLKPDEELRRSIVARFHLEAIPSGGGGDGKKGGKSDKLAAWGMQNSGSGASQNNGGQKLRYRDGVVVATKGEKVRALLCFNSVVIKSQNFVLDSLSSFFLLSVY